jgi:acetyl esterase
VCSSDLFVYGDLDSHDASVRYLAEHSGVRILSVDYRLAPEDRFPAGCDDAVAAFRWARTHAAALSADPAKIAVGGDSAGGNLATVVAREVGAECAFQLLIYPVVDFDSEPTRSKRLFNDGFFLTQSFMDFVEEQYVAPDQDRSDPRLSPLLGDVPADLAPAFLCTAGFDPLRDEGEAYAQKMLDAGIEVESWRYADQIHGFLNTLVVRSSRVIVADIADALARGLA